MGEALPQIYIPNEDELRAIVRDSGFANTSYSGIITSILNERAPVLGHFVVTETPDEGPAPQSVREQWLGLALPIRCRDMINDDDHPVLAIEAIDALKRAERDSGYDWWWKEYADDGDRLTFPDGHPEFVAYTNFLTFNDRYGRMVWGSSAQTE